MNKFTGLGTLIAASVLLGACASPGVPQDHREPRTDRDATTRWLTFPLNVGPDVVVDTGALALDVVISPLLGLDPGNLWPLAILISPVAGPIQGIEDAAQGDPFWDCWAVDEYARRLSHENEAHGDR